MKNTVRVSVVAVAVAAMFQAPAFAQSLQDSVNMAIKTNPDVLVETNQRLANDEAVKGARGGFFPKVDLLAGTLTAQSMESFVYGEMVAKMRKYHTLKGGILPCVLRPFAGRKAVFYASKGCLTDRKTMGFGLFLTFYS